MFQSASLNDDSFGDAGNARPVASVDILALQEKSALVARALKDYFGFQRRSSEDVYSSVEILEISGDHPTLVVKIRYFLIGSLITMWDVKKGIGRFEIRWDGEDDITVLTRLDGGDHDDADAASLGPREETLALRERSAAVISALMDFYSIGEELNSKQSVVEILRTSLKRMSIQRQSHLPRRQDGRNPPPTH